MMYSGQISEFNFSFGRMNIKIDIFRRNVKKQKTDRMTSAGQVG